MKLRSLLMLGSVAVLSAAFTSCSKDIAFDSEGYMAQQKSEYDKNFIAKYGAVDPNQTWDFATMTPISTLPSQTSAARTRAGEISITGGATGETMTIGKSVIDWMHEKMKAGKNNAGNGIPFISKITQERSFTIVPFYQGKASYFWELWMNIGGVDQKIWTKNENLQYKGTDNDWYGLTDDGVPASAQEIKAPTYTFTATKDASMYFYLKVWTGGKTSHDNGDAPTRVSSLDKMMLALDVLALGGDEMNELLANVPQTNDVNIIGCEDNSKNGSDNDFEDLVFMMYGAPTERVEEIEVRETKRYMMEDLGTKDDFDFNDVVVDLSIVYTKKYTYRINTNGVEELVSEVEVPNTRHQEAIVRAAGGTLDFTIEIGTNTITTWKKSQLFSVTNMLNTGWNNTSIYYSGKESELAKFDIKKNDWNPATNNIRVIVEDHGANSGVKTIQFPKQGEIPMIIAVEDTQNWMTERTSVPSSWWY